MNNDRIEGAVRNFTGKAEEAVGNMTEDAKTQANGMADQVAGNVQNAFGKAKDAAGDMADNAQDAAAGLGATVQDRVRKFSAQATEVGGQVYHQAADAGRYATQQIKEQPLAAALIVGALGGILGFMLGRASVPEPTLRDYAQRAIPRRYR
ncbi:MAG TPA: CsbD family protein [Acetobacteraceae bacterium]|jgi:uncharacterized protein YjbJ (UPF0337 family)